MKGIGVYEGKLRNDYRAKTHREINYNEQYDEYHRRWNRKSASIEDDATRATSIGEFTVVAWGDSMSKTMDAYERGTKGEDEHATRRSAEDVDPWL